MATKQKPMYTLWQALFLKTHDDTNIGEPTLPTILNILQRDYCPNYCYGLFQICRNSQPGEINGGPVWIPALVPHMLNARVPFM